jgi:hypothetical protein
LSPRGDIFVVEGHSGQNANATPDTVARISKFTADGKFIKSWGKMGTTPGEFRTPHARAFDSNGRLFVADRGNVRLQIFDQEGTFLGETKAFSRLSGIFIDRNDVLYGADQSAATSNPGWRLACASVSRRLRSRCTSFDPESRPAGRVARAPRKA